jgi:hypothetical protein
VFALAHDPDTTEPTAPTAGADDAAEAFAVAVEAQAGAEAAAFQAREERRRLNRMLLDARTEEDRVRLGVTGGTHELAAWGQLRDERIMIEWLLDRRTTLPDRLLELVSDQPLFWPLAPVYQQPEAPARQPVPLLPRQPEPIQAELWPTYPEGEPGVLIFTPEEARVRELEMAAEYFAARNDRGHKSRPRKCSPLPRALTHNVEQLERMHRVDPPRRRARSLPMFRAQCENKQRPCPYVSCRQHMAFSVDEEDGSIKEHYPHLRIFDDPEGDGLDVLEATVGTCALDISARYDYSDGVGGLLRMRQLMESGHPIGLSEGGAVQEEAARLLNLSVERVRQLGAKGLQEGRAHLRRTESEVTRPRAPLALAVPVAVASPAAAAKPKKSRSCPAPGCGERADVLGVACRGHWTRVPRAARLQLWAAWPLSAEAVEAAREIAGKETT